MTSETELRELRDTCRRYLSDHRPLSLLDGSAEDRRRLWEGLASTGWAATLVPEALGGMGWGWAEAAVLAQELGRVVAPVPFLSTAILGPSGLKDLSHPEASATLSAVATGQVRMAVAGLDAHRQPGDTLVISASGGGDRLSGHCSFVLDAALADRVLVVADRDGATVVALPVADAKVDRRPLDLVDTSRTAASVTFEKTPVTVLADGPGAAAAVAAMESALALGLACDALGGAETVLAMAVEYAKTRVQFDRPIGSFQAVKHRLADLYVLLEGAAAVVEAAVARQAETTHAETGSEFVALVYAADAYARIAGDAVLVHGAIGFTWEHPIHRFLKRALLDQQLAGPFRDHRERHLQRRLAGIGAA